MDLALYNPDPESPGYYLNPKISIGSQGDFITAPELSDLFGFALAESIYPVLKQCDNPCILELGAGSGKLAADILSRLKDLNLLPNNYFILERSGVFKKIQYEYLNKQHPDFIKNIIWLDNLENIKNIKNSKFNGVILGNEVCDALCVKLFKKIDKKNFELFVGPEINHLENLKQNLKQNLKFYPETPDPELLKIIQEIESRQGVFPDGYQSEICLVLKPWLSYLNQFLNQGIFLFIDYGYAEKDYYSAHRSTGTLLSYQEHKAYDNPLVNIGQRDITAHVNFSWLAEIGVNHLGLDLLGYNTQMMFLAACHIDQLRIIYQTDNLKNIKNLNTLMHPDLMGEVFKVMVLGKHIPEESMTGFEFQDLRHLL